MDAATKHAAITAITALSEIETQLADTLGPMISSKSYQHHKKNDHGQDGEYVNIAKILAPGPIFTLEQLAANGHSATVAAVILPWLPAFLAHKGLAASKSMGAGQPTFDSFVHKVPEYR